MFLEIVRKSSELNTVSTNCRDLRIQAIKEPSRFWSDEEVRTGNE